ncbi:MAG: 2-C-methyl-D-erythritol 4-phosphate cytidylyltransferase [Armatimonadetes bacterium]|nr:2-C-methyl-D-erythritol 4-phosphate cytidylyltransferase [Armatimonadota bacterium]
MFAAVILAAGSGSRAGFDKCFEQLGDKPVWRWSYDFFSWLGYDTVVVTSSERLKLVTEAGARGIPGGETRQQSCRQGALAVGSEYVIIHDAARPFLTAEVLDRVKEAAVRVGAAAASLPMTDTVRMSDEGGWRLLDRSVLRTMQTPQIIRRDWLLEAHSHFADESLTDDIELVARMGRPIELVDGSPSNFKITYAEDFETARKVVNMPPWNSELA